MTKTDKYILTKTDKCIIMNYDNSIHKSERPKPKPNRNQKPNGNKMSKQKTETKQTETEQAKTDNAKPTIWNGIDGKPIGINHNIGPNELSFIISENVGHDVDQKTVRNFLRTDPITSAMMPTDGSNMFWTVFRNGTELVDHIINGFMADRSNRMKQRIANKKTKQIKRNRQSFDMVDGKLVNTSATETDVSNVEQ